MGSYTGSRQGNGFCIAFVLVLSGALAGLNGSPLYAQTGDDVVIPALQGTWSLIERGNVISSDKGPKAIFAFDIQGDGSLEWASVDYRTGELRPGGVTPQWYRRRIVYTDADSIAFMQSYSFSEEEVLVAGRWELNQNDLTLYLEQGGRRFNDVLRRTTMGDQISEPVKIEATLDINGATITPYQQGGTPSGRVFLMHVEETQVSLRIMCAFNETEMCTVRPRIPSFHGPGRYEIDTEAEHLSSISVSDAETRMGKYVNAATSGYIEIAELDPETKRCRGSMDIVFNNPFHSWTQGPTLHVRGTFDLPVIVLNELDITTHVISTTKK